MAKILSLDWDYQLLHVVSANVGRGSVRILQTAVSKETQSPNLGEAEALGQLLRERLKTAGIAPAPVIVAVGRDRLIVKDVRYPKVPPSEEPAIVRFQAVKELTEPPDEVVIDYVPIGEPSATGEQRALALVMRKELLATYQTICKAAGLKLLGVAPRSFGMMPALKQVVGTTVLTPPPDPPDSTVAVLALTERWAEFAVGRNKDLLLARSLQMGNTLAGEIRRNVSVHAGQHQQQPIRAVYIAGSGEQGGLRERLQDMLGIGIYPLDPLEGIEKPDLPPGNRGGFLGAVGLLHAYSVNNTLPINFIKPKQPAPPRDPNKRRLVAVAAVAAAVLVAGVFTCYSRLAAKDSKMELLYLKKTELEQRLVTLEEDAKRIKALDDWTATEIVWLDELYDLTQRFPSTESIRLLSFQADPIMRGGKDKHVARLALKGITTRDLEAVNALQDQLREETSYYRVAPKVMVRNTAVDRQRFPEQFSSQIDIEKRPPSKYMRQLPLVSDDEQPRDRRGGGQGQGLGMDMFGGGQ